MVEISDSDFEALVGDALDLVPDELAEQMNNVVILIEDGNLADGLLGLYEGTPLPERGEWYGTSGTMPDTITIYRLPLLATCSTLAELRDEVAITVLHEIAHHFGIDDDRLDLLGWA